MKRHHQIMQSSKCLFSASAALHRVFIYPIETAIPQYLHQSLRQNVRPLRTQFPKSFAIQSRSYATEPARTTSTERRLPRNAEIRNHEVNIIDEDGVFHEAMPTREVLLNIDLRTHTLVCVTKPPDDWTQPAIAKVMTKTQLAEMVAHEKELAKESKKKKPHTVTKILELNWAIDNNDLGHKINKMKEFLGKGNRLEVTVSPKRKGKKLPVADMEGLLSRLRKVVQTEEAKKMGWSEWRAMDGELDPPPPEEGEPEIPRNKIGVVTLHFQGKVNVEVATEEAEVEVEKEIEEEGEEKEGRKLRKKRGEVKKEKELTAAQLKKREKWKKKEMGEPEELSGSW